MRRLASCLFSLGRQKAILGSAALVLCTLAILCGGCVSKAQADARARAAFVAGQQAAMSRLQPSPTGQPGQPNPFAQQLSVLVIGPVKVNQVPWTPGLTLAGALVTADYIGQTDPKDILINRNGQQIHVDPKKLLGGEDVPLEAQDVVEIR